MSPPSHNPSDLRPQANTFLPLQVRLGLYDPARRPMASKSASQLPYTPKSAPGTLPRVTAVNALTEGDYNTEISGNLDFRGTPKNITFKANVNVEGDKLTIKSEEFKINRQDFGIVYKGGGDSIIKDDVMLQVDVTADKNQ